jgi:hypothetical protein
VQEGREAKNGGEKKEDECGKMLLILVCIHFWMKIFIMSIFQRIQ